MALAREVGSSFRSCAKAVSSSTTAATGALRKLGRKARTSAAAPATAMTVRRTTNARRLRRSICRRSSSSMTSSRLAVRESKSPGRGGAEALGPSGGSMTPPERALGTGGIPNWTSPAGGAPTGWAEVPSGGDVPKPSGRPHGAPAGTGPGAVGLGTPGTRPRAEPLHYRKLEWRPAGVVGAGGGGAAVP